MDKAIDAVLIHEDEERCWSLYCSCMANPLLAGDLGGYEDFLQTYGSKPGVQKSSQKTEPEMNDVDIQEQVKRAEKMLKNCTPKRKAVR